MGEVLIDLGEMAPRGRQQTAPATTRRRPSSYRAVLAALTVVLIAPLTASVHRTPPLPPVIVEARLGDMTYVTRDRLFVVSAGPELIASAVQNKIVSEYGLPGGVIEWRAVQFDPDDARARRGGEHRSDGQREEHGGLC